MPEEFVILPAENRWNEKALQVVFWNGLSANIFKELACRDDVLSLDSHIDFIHLDNLFRDRANSIYYRIQLYAPEQPHSFLSELMQLGTSRISLEKRR